MHRKTYWLSKKENISTNQPQIFCLEFSMILIMPKLIRNKSKSLRTESAEKQGY